MKKKVIIVITVFIVVALGIVVFYHLDRDIIARGNKIFGKDYCQKNNKGDLHEDREHPMNAGQAITPYKCKLCRKKYEHPNTATPKICPSCATMTQRCRSCGKLKNI